MSATGRSRLFRNGVRGWLAAGTFVLGLVIGGVIVGLVSGGSSPMASGDDSSDSASPTAPAPSSSATTGATAQATVNEACLRAINESQQAYAAVSDLADAVRSLNASRIDEIIRTLQPLQKQLETDIAACQVVTTLPNGALTTSTPTPTPS